MADYIEIYLPLPEFVCGEPYILSLTADLPGLSILDLGDAPVPVRQINLDLPSPEVAITLRSGGMGSINASLGWPDLDQWSATLKGGGQISISLPSYSFAAHSLVGNLISIAAQLPSSTGSFGASQNNLGHIHIKLPGVDGDVHVLSEIKGHITGALPPLSFRGHTAVGSVGSISAELPLIYYDSILLSEGLIQLDITLPCVVFDSTGSMEDASITYRTIVMNTKNFCVTEYGDLELKGMVDIFGQTIAINGNQLVKIGHTLDDLEHINASFQTGTLDFSTPYWVKPRDVWVTMRSGKKVRMTIKDNEVPTNESTYDSSEFVESLQKSRVKVGRGFYSEFFDMTFENVDGELVDISNIHVHSEKV